MTGTLVEIYNVTNRLLTFMTKHKQVNNIYRK